MNDDELDVGYDFDVTRIEERESGGGAWVHGRLNGHRFQALVFPEHARVSEYEIDGSRISKLWIQRLADKREVFNWDRGPDAEAADATVEAIIGFLTTGLADFVYAE